MAATTSAFKRPRINLDVSSSIDLTQPSNSKRKASQKGTQGGNAGNSQVNDGTADQWTLCPMPHTEPPVITKLSGNSDSIFVELCGWSYQTPLRFYNIRDSTRLTDMTDGKGNIIPVAEDLKRRCITLKEMEAEVGCYQRVVTSPVYVQVVAKRKVDVIVSNEKVMIIPLIVVADSSGYCVVCSFNEGLATLYNAVDVGDQLLITRCLPQTPRRTFHRGIFSINMFINLELKLQFHSVRNHYIRRFSSLKLSEFKMPEELFDCGTQVKLPSELEKELGSTEPLPWLTLPSSEQYYDIIGVVNYVGRVERFRTKDISQEVKCLVDGELQTKPYTRFLLYRWIHLYDKTSNPFPVKVYLNNTTVHCQDELVPGAIVIISHCQTTEMELSYFAKHTCTSPFSQIYLSGNIQKYFMLHPLEHRNKVREFLVRSKYCDIASRADVVWSVGGTQSFKITSEQNFLSNYSQRKGSFIHEIDVDLPMVRRESRRFHFEGMIWRIIEIVDENEPAIIYLHQQYKEEKDRKSDYKVLENFLSYHLFENTSWYSFNRQLPSIDPTVLQEQKCRDIVKKIVTSYKDYCKSLLMPSELDEKNLPPAAGLKKVDGSPYFIIDFGDRETKHWYQCIWKTLEYSHSKKLDKLNKAKGKNLVCVADVFCVEPGAPLEVNLHDFVIESDNP